MYRVRDKDLTLFFYMQLSSHWRVLVRYLGIRIMCGGWRVSSREQLGSDEYHRGLSKLTWRRWLFLASK